MYLAVNGGGARLRRSGMSRTLRSLAGERGSAMLLVEIAMVALIGFAALAVDGGYMYSRYARLQNIADSAALAASHAALGAPGAMWDKEQAAFGAALECARRNGLQVSSIDGYAFDMTLGDETGQVRVSFGRDLLEVRVDIRLDARLFFARVLSIEAATLGVTAVAETAHAGGTGHNSLIPLAFFQGAYTTNVRTHLTFVPGGGVQGNYGYLDYGPSNLFAQYLTGGFPGVIAMGSVIETYPGEKTGQVRDAIASRVAGCTHSCSVRDLDGNNDGCNVEIDVCDECSRVVVIPTVAGFFESNGRSYVTVTGFLRFFIDGYDSNTKLLTGWCLGQAAPGDYTSTEGLTMRSVRLKR